MFPILDLFKRWGHLKLQLQRQIRTGGSEATAPLKLYGDCFKHPASPTGPTGRLYYLRGPSPEAAKFSKNPEIESMKVFKHADVLAMDI